MLLGEHTPTPPGQDAAMVVAAMAAYANDRYWHPVPLPGDAWVYAWNTVQIYARYTCDAVRSVKWHRPEYPPPGEQGGGRGA